MSKQLEVHGSFDRLLIRERGQSVRYLVVDVVAPELDNAKSKRPPLNVAMVIDASGSMGGPPLVTSKKAVDSVCKGLKDGDVLSVVSFAEDVRVHVDAVELRSNRREALDAIEAIQSRGLTDLAGGWLKGAECVAKAMEKRANLHNHVVLLSDGHANKGIVEPLILEGHADELRKRHVYTSTVGIGNGYSSTQLEALAEFGGGRMHDAESPDEIFEVVVGELSELSRCVTDNVELILTFPVGCKVNNVSRFPMVVEQNRVRVSLGSLGPSQKKTTVFRVTAPSGSIGARLDFQAGASAVVAGKGIVTSSVSNAVLSYAPEHHNSTQPRLVDVATTVARVWQASVVRRAVELNRIGDFAKLQSYLDHEILYLARYSEGLPDARAFLNELVKLRDVADRDWDERSRKDIQMSTYQSLHGYKDFRTTQRDHWTSKLPSDD